MRYVHYGRAFCYLFTLSSQWLEDREIRFFRAFAASEYSLLFFFLPIAFLPAKLARYIPSTSARLECLWHLPLRYFIAAILVTYEQLRRVSTSDFVPTFNYRCAVHTAAIEIAPLKVRSQSHSHQTPF